MGNCLSRRERENFDDVHNLAGTGLNSGVDASLKSIGSSVGISSKSINPGNNIPLDTVNPKDVPSIPHKGKVIPAKVTSVYDGDTCTVIFVYGGDYLKWNIRIIGVDAPEVKVRGDSSEIAKLEEKAGAHVRDKVRALINNKILDIRMDKWDKYGGRVNGAVILPSPSQYTTLTEYLLAKKYAKEYHGQKKEEWTRKELEYILKN